MFTSGFVEEVRHLLDHGLAEGRTAPRAIGYREVVAHLRGELTEQEARDQTAQATRRFARRQDSWFRKDPRIVWIRYDDPQLVDKAVRSGRRWLRSLRSKRLETSRVEAGSQPRLTRFRDGRRAPSSTTGAQDQSGATSPPRARLVP